MNDKKVKHLEMIQAAINRLAGNSITVKGWGITLVSALFALAAKDADIRFVLVSYFPAGMFWLLDGYFLSQERRFRNLYDQVRTSTEEGSDFSMDTTKLVNGQARWIFSMFSVTLLIFYGIAIGTICFVGLYFRYKK